MNSTHSISIKDDIHLVYCHVTDSNPPVTVGLFYERNNVCYHKTPRINHEAGSVLSKGQKFNERHVTG